MITDEIFKKGKFWTDGPMVVTGCTKVSPGCKNCWSEQAHVMRSKGPNAHVWPTDCLTDGRFNGKVHFNLKSLERAVKGKKSRRIAIWNDLHHGGVSFDNRYRAYDLMYRNSQHIYLIITKRIERVVEYLERENRIIHSLGENCDMSPANIWHIATMENPEMVDKRMPHLLRIPGKRGIIIEPMLGPVELAYSFVRNCPELPGCEKDCVVEQCMGKYIHQVILGPENGKGKRPFEEEWAESVKAQCERAGIPFYRKDRGEGELIWR